MTDKIEAPSTDRISYTGLKRFTITQSDAGSEAYRDEYVRWLEHNIIAERSLAVQLVAAEAIATEPVTVGELREAGAGRVGWNDGPWYRHLLTLAAEELERLRKQPAEPGALHPDTARLNHLDWLNQTLNEHTGSNYGWGLDVNHNRCQVWLSDSHHPKLTVREAIDASMADATADQKPETKVEK